MVSGAGLGGKIIIMLSLSEVYALKYRMLKHYHASEEYIAMTAIRDLNEIRAQLGKPFLDEEKAMSLWRETHKTA